MRPDIHQLYLLFAMMVLPITAGAQIIIEGTIKDAATGEPLPAANIILDDRFSGTISNPDGQYSLKIEELPVYVSVRYIGYQTETRMISKESETVQNFELRPAIFEMDEIVVTDEDPAFSIMERVILRKQIWRADLQNYSADAYTRQVLKNDTTIVSITETISKAFWDREKGHREVLKSQKRTSNMQETANFSGVSYVPNFYDDNIEIAGFNMMGPTHPDALRYYDFSIDDYLKIDEQVVYRIRVTPRRKLQPLFRGFLYVLDREYALLEVNLEPNEVVSFPSPIRDFSLSYEQQFSNYGGDFWLPVDMRIDGTIRIAMVGLRFPPMNFSQVSRISDYEVNTLLPDTLYQQQQTFSVDSTTIRDQAMLEQSLDRVPLTVQEEIAYEEIDSTATLEKVFRPSGFLADALMDDEESDSQGITLGLPRIFSNEWIPGELGVNVHFNRVDGFHLGMKYDLSLNDFQLQGHSGYNTHAKDWDYGVNAEFRWLRNDLIHSSIYTGFSDSGVKRYDSRYQTWMNSLSSLLGGYDYFDYYRSQNFKTGIRFRLPKQNILTSLSYIIGNHNSRDLEVMDYSLFGWHSTRRSNPPVNEGDIRAINVDLGINTKSDNFGLAGNRSLLFQLEYSGSELGSDFEYVRLATRANWNTQTFYKRRLMPNTLDVHFSAGVSMGDVPIQKNFTIDGSMTGFTPFGVLKTRRGLPYEGDRYWLLYAEHNFRTIPFELLGLRSIAERGWGIILFGGAGESDIHSSLYDNNPVLPRSFKDGVHTEAGVSINSVFGIGRIDFAKRLDSPGYYAGFSVPRYF